MIESVRQRFAEVQARVRQYERLAARLAELQRTLAAEAAHLGQLREQLKKEYQDAAGRAIAAGTRGARGPAVTEESRKKAYLDYLAAMQKHDEIGKAVDGIERDVSELRAGHPAPAHAESEAVIVAEPVEQPQAEPAHAAQAESAHEAAAIAEPPAEVAAPPEPPAHESAAPDDEEKAIQEAIETGRRALADIDRCVELAESVARGGAWHVIASAVRSKSPDHAKLDEAARLARDARESLRRFRDQATALRQRYGDRVDVEEAVSLGDHFLGALAAATAGGSKYHQLADAAHAAYHDVRSATARLQLLASHVRARRRAASRTHFAAAAHL